MTEEYDDNSKIEDQIVEKVAELMETLDEVEKYNVVDKCFKKFAAIVISSVIILIFANIFLTSSGFLMAYNPAQRFFLSFLLVIIPLSGVASGILFVKRKIHAVKTGEWKKELSEGFPSALKKLSNLNWSKSFDAISSGGLGYSMYGLVKGLAYWIIIYFTLGFALNITTYIILNQTQVLGGASVWFSLLITFVYLKKELSKRFNEIRALDKLHWELRRLEYDLKNVEF